MVLLDWLVGEVEASETRLLDEACKLAGRKGRLTADQIAKLSRLFGERFNLAIKAVREMRVKKYVFNPSGRVVWIVVGRERDYQVIPEVNFCTCDDFYFHVIDRKTPICYHLIAQKIAEALREFDLIEDSDEIYGVLMDEWRKFTVRERRLSTREVEELRRIVEEILIGGEEMTVGAILKRIRGMGFRNLTTRQLAAILSTDPNGRFKCIKGLWSLRS